MLRVFTCDTDHKRLAFAWQAELQGYSTMALVAAMARGRAGAQALTVAMEGGHGEWFVQGFDAGGAALAEPVSLPPDEAVATFRNTVVAGTTAEKFVQLAGAGTALPLYSDAREFAALPAAALSGDTAPIYGRAPDAKPSGAAMGQQA